MALYIFSDVHLGSGSPESEKLKYQKVKEIIDLVNTDGDRLVILGDLFDFWFEYKHAMPKDQFPILNLLYDLNQKGIPVDYVSGNHDFWMDDFFTEQLGLTLHKDFLDMEYQGKKLHLIHGDGLSPSDKGYHFLKKILRNPVNIWLYRKLPPDWAIPLAKFVSGTSRDYTTRREHHFEKDYEDYAKSKLSEGIDLVAIGHLHIPVYKEFDDGIYINTGDFINHFSYAKITQNSVNLNYLK
jgi:UDP-2,3-diacylglucosamine hydrolase